ncbi:MAG: hypothetical protein ACU0AZ_00790, partial [Paracoccaceae bacterium]
PRRTHLPERLLSVATNWPRSYTTFLLIGQILGGYGDGKAADSNGGWHFVLRFGHWLFFAKQFGPSPN